MKNNYFSELSNFSDFDVINCTEDGILYKAIDNQSKKILIKIYYPNLSWSDEQILSFLDQINRNKTINHANLLTIIDCGRTKKFPYVIYEYKSVAPLAQIIHEDKSSDNIISILKQLVTVIQFLHHKEIIHGNLSTQIIYCDENNDLFLLDFGIYKYLHNVIQTNAVGGLTNLSINLPEYSTPEQLLGNSPTTYSDIYGIGLITFEYLFHQKAFVGETGVATALAHLENKIYWPKGKLRKSSIKWVKFIRKCLILEPHKRFKNIDQVVEIIEKLQSGKIVYVNIPPKYLKNVPGYSFNRKWIYGISVPIIITLTIAMWFIHITPLRYYSGFEQNSLAETDLISELSPQIIVPKEETPTKEIPSKNISSEEIVEINPTSFEQKIELIQPSIQKQSISQPREKITIENIQDLTEISRLGYGRLEDIDHLNNEYFFVASSSGVYIYQGTQFIKWIDAGNWVTSIKISKNGEKLALGLKSGEIQIWDWKNNNLLLNLNGHDDRISGLEFSIADRYLYSISHDRYFIVWDLNSGVINQRVLAHATPINDFSITSDGRTLITVANDQVVRVWDLATGKKDFDFPFPGKTASVALSSDDQYVAAGGGEGLIYQWNLKTKQLRTDPIPVKTNIWNIEYSENDLRMLVSTGNGSKSYSPTQTKYPGISLDFEIKSPSNNLISIFGLNFDFDNKVIENASINWNGKLEINRTEIIPDNSYDSLYQLVFSRNSDFIAVGGKNANIFVWNIYTNELVLDLNRVMPEGYIFTPDGFKIIVMESKTYPVSIHYPKPVTKTIYRTYSFLSNKNEIIFSESVENGWISFAKDDSLMISGSANQSKGWDLNTGFEVYLNSYRNNGCMISTSKNNGELLQVISNAGGFSQFDDRTSFICSKTYLIGSNLSTLSHDLNYIFQETSNNSIVATDTSTNKTIWEIKIPSDVTTIAISFDGSILALGDSTGQVVLLNSKNGEEIRRFTGNYGSVQRISFSEDGYFLGTVGTDGTTRLFIIS